MKYYNIQIQVKTVSGAKTYNQIIGLPQGYLNVKYVFSSLWH